MPRKSFLRKLKSLNEKVSQMGTEVELKLDQTAKVLKDIDLDIAQEVYESDNIIDKIEHSIEKYCINLFALEQPIAGDLRNITGCLKIITDLERIADQCADICEIIINDGINESSSYLKDIILLFNSVQDMFLKTMETFANRDTDTAISICKSDDEIDKRYSEIVYSACENIKEGSGDVMGDMGLVFINKYIERIGDHCTNIAEWVIYMKTGEHSDLND